MLLLNILHASFLLFFIFSTLMVIFSSNPVYSALFLILSFLSASAILFLLKVDFLGILFVIIYVGAIAVLFLFVVMMLNIKLETRPKLMYLPFFLVACFCCVLQMVEGLETVFSSFKLLYSTGISLSDNLSNTQVLGQVLFNYFLPSLLVAGLILLVSMLGAILLTLNFQQKSKQIYLDSTRQLARSEFFLSKFK